MGLKLKINLGLELGLSSYIDFYCCFGDVSVNTSIKVYLHQCKGIGTVFAGLLLLWVRLYSIVGLGLGLG